MSLYGALFSGVSGLAGQANVIGALSDNISNVNTVGYKSVQGIFETLVTNSGTVAYSPGGVLGRSASAVDLQGLLQTTNNNTDVAISGDGFFVVNTTADSSGSVQYTRAGSFRQDSTGNFQNSAGYFLQGWPLDSSGRLPGEAGNVNTTSFNSLTSLETVNVSSLTGSAAATSTITISANLEASESQFPGASLTGAFDANSSDNFQITADDVIVPSTVNSLAIGDRFVVESSGGSTSTFRYGGLSFSKSVTTGQAGDNGEPTVVSPLTLGDDPFTTGALGSGIVTVRHGNHGLSDDDVVEISGATDVDGITASQLNQSFVISVVDEDRYTITTAGSADAGTTSGGAAAVQADFRVFSGNILDASTATSTFLGTTGTGGFTSAALSFTISTASVGTQSFTYTGGTPNTQNRQFNTLNNLAASISSVDGLTARVVDNRLYVSGTDANEAITFANNPATGAGSGATLTRGIDWVGELGLENIIDGENRFSTLSGLESVINAANGFSASITNPDSSASIAISVDDPLATVTIRDQAAVTTGTTFNGGATPIVTAFGSNEVTLNYTASHGYAVNDIVQIDPTTIAGYETGAAPVASDFAVTAGSSTITVTTTGAHGLALGAQERSIDLSSFAGFPSGNIGGIPLSELEGVQSINVTGVNTYEITSLSAATANTSTSSTAATYGTIAGIPLNEFDGKFEILEVPTTTTFKIAVSSAATTSVTSTADNLFVGDPTNGGSLIAELGLVDSLDSTLFTVEQTTGSLGPAYTAGDMATGAATPQFFTNVQVFDSLGTGHDLRVAFLKTGGNVWAAEVYAVPATDLINNANGLLATGNINFNGDGSLLSIDAALTAEFSPAWSNGAVSSPVDIDWGTAGSLGTGLSDGLSQFDADYRLNFANQNGVPVGEIIGIEIDSDGVVTARFSNGEEQAFYKIPLADFPNPNGLAGTTGNVFTESRESGTVNLRESGSSGVGTFQASALENSNVELSEQLTDMIIAQRSYQANTKVISAADELLEELNRTV